MIPFNWFDVLLAAMIALSAITGLRTGFIRVVIGLVAAIAGVLLGFWCYRIVAAKIMPYVSTEALADMLGFAIIFFGIVLLGSLISALLAKLFRWIGLSWFDHFLGGVVGLARGVLVVASVAATLLAFTPSPAPAFLANSRMLPYATEVAAGLAAMAPRDLKASFLEQWENLKQHWSHPERNGRARAKEV